MLLRRAWRVIRGEEQISLSVNFTWFETTSLPKTRGERSITAGVARFNFGVADLHTASTPVPVFLYWPKLVVCVYLNAGITVFPW